MKKVYEAPSIVFEEYELDSNIASNCGIVVSNGPAAGTHSPCEDYLEKDPFEAEGISLYGVHNVQFYEDTNCDCYTTGGDYGYWTS